MQAIIRRCLTGGAAHLVGVGGFHPQRARFKHRDGEQ
jgi:hypothetical protein